MNKEQTIKLAASAVIVALIFTSLVSVLMLINYYRYKAQDPLELESMKVLVERLHNEPNNDALREEIRNLDLLARRAFFTNQWQVKTGRYLLLIGGIVLVVALRYYYSAISKIQEPGSVRVNEMITRTISQRWIVFGGILLLLLAFTASFGLTDHLARYEIAAVMDEGQGDKEAVEVIRVTEDQGVATDSGVAERAGEDTAPVTGEQAEVVPEQGGDQGKPPDQAPAGESTEKPGTGFEQEILKNHNGFRGPLGNGISYHKNIPVDWDGASGRNIRWKVSLSLPGFNSPVIWGNKIFVAGADKETQVVYCLNINTGEIIWQKEIKDIPGSPSQRPRVTEDTGLSAPTMTTDGTRVYALFATGDLAALNMEGKIEWARNLGVPENHYGHSSSLITWNKRLLIQYDSNRGGRVLSLDTATGKTQWDQKRNTGISWASPVLAEINGRYQLILSSAPLVAAYDPETGNELWGQECLLGEVGSSPAFGEGLVFAANEYARLVAIKPGEQPEVVWEEDEYMPEAASPVVSGGLLFVPTSYGVLACYNATTGEKYWEDQLNQGFYASPMVADGKLYALDVGGVMHIYTVSKEMKKIGEPALGEGAVATPAFSPGRIYLRGDNNLYCIETN